MDFDRYVNDRGQQFLESIDEWLSAKETEAMKYDIKPRVKVGLGVYMFVRPIEGEISDQPES